MSGVLDKFVSVKPDEIRGLMIAFVFHFVVLAGYYVIRPIRDEIGASSGVENLPWMFTATLITMLVANALFSAVVARMSRRRFIPIAYRFVIANLILFFVLMRVVPAARQPWVARSFFVWVSVVNLFVTTVFWAFMTDLFTTEQSKRLFGFIAVGGSLGAILGSSVTSSLAHHLSAGGFLLISTAMFEVAARCVRFFPTEFRPAQLNAASSTEPQPQGDPAADKPIGGRFWEGVTHICRSPYLLALILFIMLYTMTSTWAYFQQSDLTRAGLTDRAARTAFLSRLDLFTNTLTVLMQIFLTGVLLKWLGVTPTLLMMPVLSLFGFAAIGYSPVLSVLAAFQVARRASTFAFMRPAREVLFTVLRREDKYKAKSFIDTFGYRLGDQIGAWTYGGLHAVGLGLSSISYLAVPLVAGWCALGIWLGRKQRALAEKRTDPERSPGRAGLA